MSTPSMAPIPSSSTPCTLPPHPLLLPPTWTSLRSGENDTPHLACSPDSSPTASPPRALTSITAKPATVSISAAAPPTRRSSIATTAASAAPAPSRAISPFHHWTRGLAWAILGFRRTNSNSSTTLPEDRHSNTAELPPNRSKSSPPSKMPPARHRRLLHRPRYRRLTAAPYWDTAASPAFTISKITAISPGRLPSTITNPSIPPLPPSAAQGLHPPWKISWRLERQNLYFNAGLTNCHNPSRRTLPLHATHPRRPAPPHHLPPPERLGPHPSRPQIPFATNPACGAITTS